MTAEARKLERKKPDPSLEGNRAAVERMCGGKRKKERRREAAKAEKGKKRKGFSENKLGREPASEVKDWNLGAPLLQQPEALASPVRYGTAR